MYSPPEIIGHRGDPVAERENTLAAVHAARAAGVRTVEIDVRVTRDGHPVLLHDETTERLWGRAVPIAEQTLTQVQELTEGPWRIPTLEEVLAEFDGGLLIDLNTAAEAAATWELVKGADQDRVAFCGELEALAQIRRRTAHGQIYLTWKAYAPPTPGLLAEIRPQYVNPQHRLLRATWMDYFAQRGVPVCTWTVDEVEDLDRVCGLGVAAVISNQVARSLSHLAGRRTDA